MKVMKNVNPLSAQKMSDIVSNNPGAIASKAVCTTDSTEIRFFSYAKDESISKEFQEEDTMIYLIEGQIKIQYDEDGEAKEALLNSGEFIVLPSNLNYGMYANQDSKSLNILVK